MRSLFYKLDYQIYRESTSDRSWEYSLRMVEKRWSILEESYARLVRI